MREFVAALVIVTAAPAAAQNPPLDAARAAGAVGERYDGYLGIAAPIAGAARTQVSKINIQRRALYSNLGSLKGANPQDVGVTAGCQLLARVTVGETYMLADGKWRRRAAGQAPPAPDYCR